MKEKPFSEGQVIGVLREAQGGVSVNELCRKHGISDARFDTWRKKYVGKKVSDVRRLKSREAENGPLKKLLVESLVNQEELKAELSGKY